jgi:3-hydroxyisobutyrate dehydrogenase
MARIGFIGLGKMGLPMAGNLIKAGHVVVGFDLLTPQVAKLSAMGGIAVRSVGAAAKADAVITMLPTGTHVRDVATARELATRAADKGLAMVDAPVSGGVAGAEAGSLTFMVGGSEADFARAKPILEAMGKIVIHA